MMKLENKHEDRIIHSPTENHPTFKNIPALQSILADASHVDVKTIEGGVTMRQFIASMMAYQPGWVAFLYKMRAMFVRFLGMKQEGIPKAPRITPETVPMNQDEPAAFFSVRHAKEDSYWIVAIDDQPLKATLAVVVESLSEQRDRFHVVTIVHYNNWAGPIYFNVIRPFHHLVVGGMVKAGVKQASENRNTPL